MLDPQYISDFYTLEEITQRIRDIDTAYALAMQSASDTFSDTQANQQTRRQNIEKLSDELNIWLRAYSYKSGNSSSTITLISATYTPDRARI